MLHAPNIQIRDSLPDTYET